MVEFFKMDATATAKFHLPVVAKVGADPPYDEDAGGEDVLPLEHVKGRQLFDLLSLKIDTNFIEDFVNLFYLLGAEFPLVPFGDAKQHILGLLLLLILGQPPHLAMNSIYQSLAL